MVWRKVGKIFNPIEYKLSDGCVEFAQSPQTIVFDDRIRIYFSTRKKESNGKFLSYISFVDFDKELNSVIDISKKTVIPLGNIGCFDEHGIFPINPLKHNNQIVAYTCGWSRRVSVSVETSIGYAISKDNGLTFEKTGDGPILTSSLNEPFLVGDPFVSFFNNIYYMWYIYGKGWIRNNLSEVLERVYKIGYATSIDGINWTKQNIAIIPDRLNENECQALPSVIKIGNYYLMAFCYRQAIDFRNNRDNAYRLGFAYSKDLINWVRDDEKFEIPMKENDWDTDMMCYPHLFQVNGRNYLLYNGNEFGRYGFGMAELIFNDFESL